MRKPVAGRARAAPLVQLTGGTGPLLSTNSHKPPHLLLHCRVRHACRLMRQAPAPAHRGRLEPRGRAALQAGSTLLHALQTLLH